MSEEEIKNWLVCLERRGSYRESVPLFAFRGTEDGVWKVVDKFNKYNEMSSPYSQRGETGFIGGERYAMPRYLGAIFNGEEDFDKFLKEKVEADALYHAEKRILNVDNWINGVKN